jgi:predicted kinase
VAGYPCSGKTTFIKENFPNTKIIDLYDFQKDKKFLSLYDIYESYKKAGDALLEACQSNEDVVFEHTLLKSIRRKEYIYFLRQNKIDSEIKIYFFIPDEEKHKILISKRGIKNPNELINSHKNITELPTSEEGFSEIIIKK